MPKSKKLLTSAAVGICFLQEASGSGSHAVSGETAVDNPLLPEGKRSLDVQRTLRPFLLVLAIFPTLFILHPFFYESRCDPEETVVNNPLLASGKHRPDVQHMQSKCAL